MIVGGVSIIDSTIPHRIPKANEHEAHFLLYAIQLTLVNNLCDLTDFNSTFSTNKNITRGPLVL